MALDMPVAVGGGCQAVPVVEAKIRRGGTEGARMNILPGRYSPTKRTTTGRVTHAPRIVTAVSGGQVAFHPEGQERPMVTPVSDFRAWAEIARVIRA